MYLKVMEIEGFEDQVLEKKFDYLLKQESGSRRFMVKMMVFLMSVMFTINLLPSFSCY